MSRHSPAVPRSASARAWAFHRRATAQVASAMPTDLDQSKIFQQYTNVLQALSKNTPLIIILDDLQWADAPSLNLLFHSLRLPSENFRCFGKPS